MPASLKSLISEVCSELLECETGVEMVVNKDDLPTVADVLLHFVHLQNSEDVSIRYGRIGKEKDNRIYNATMRQLLEIWIENGFDEKLFCSHYSIRHRIKSIWEDAISAVAGAGGKAFRRLYLKQKTINSLGTIVDILSCRSNLIQS